MSKQYLTLPSHPAGSCQLISPQFVSSDANGFSDLMYIGGNSLVAIFIPGSNSGAAWIAANIAIYVARSNGDQTNAAKYAPLYTDSGTQYLFTLPSISIPATGIYIQIPPYDFIGLDSLQLQSVSTSAPGTPVVQTNSPTVTLVTIANGTF